MLQTKVGKENLEKIFRIIERLQKASPSKPVTKNQVKLEIKKNVSLEPELSYRTITRAFRELCELNKLKQVSRGRYWLPEFWEKTMEYQRLIQKIQEEQIADMSEFLSKDVVKLVTKLSCRETCVRRKLLGLLENDGTYEKWELEDVFSGEDLQEWQDLFERVMVLFKESRYY